MLFRKEGIVVKEGAKTQVIARGLSASEAGILLKYADHLAIQRWVVIDTKKGIVKADYGPYDEEYGWGIIRRFFETGAEVVRLVEAGYDAAAVFEAAVRVDRGYDLTPEEWNLVHSEGGGIEALLRPRHKCRNGRGDC